MYIMESSPTESGACGPIARIGEYREVLDGLANPAVYEHHTGRIAAPRAAERTRKCGSFFPSILKYHISIKFPCLKKSF